jgi:serine/threonine protein kinase
MVTPAAQRPRFLAPGDKLGKYDLIRQIAVGGMAELYLARTVGIEGFEKLVVVKRILPQFATNASFVSMFLNEARLAATLHHPNIAQVYDIGQEGSEYFFAMEYIHGEDLGRLVSTATDSGVPLSLDVALTLVAGLCAGLHYAHEKVGSDGKPLNVVHRDVSPSNVLVSYDGAVKLVDFGIARAGSNPSTTRGGLKGKIGYMSPEQCRGKETLDRRSDIFSAGVLLYELTTGRLPFVDETEYCVLNQIVNTDAPPPSTLVPSYPPALEKIVLRALARDRNYRYANALQLQTDIEDFAHENRLRISPLVLARMMGTLFPARLEEWDSARAQGAFFVEQHVVRTLIESGKTGVSELVASSDEDTSISPPPVADPTGVATPLADPRVRQATPPPTAQMPTTRMATPLPRAATPLPRAATPQPLPRTPTPLPPPGAVPVVNPYGAGTLVSSSGGYGPPVAAMPDSMVGRGVGEVTERVRVPTPVNHGETAILAIPRKSKTPLIMIGAAGAIAAVIALVIVFSGGDAPAAQPSAAPTPVADPTPVREPEPEPEPEPAPAPVAAEPTPAPTPTVETVKAEPTIDDTAAEPVEEPAVEPEPARARPAKKRPSRSEKRSRPKPAKSERKSKPEPKSEPKEPAKWNDDSPFMPVRPPDKK